MNLRDSVSLQECDLVYMSVLACQTSLFSYIWGHSQFISLSLWQHHGGCCSLPRGEVRMRWCQGVWLGSVWWGAVQLLSDVGFFFFHLRGTCRGSWAGDTAANQDEAPRVLTVVQMSLASQMCRSPYDKRKRQKWVLTWWKFLNSLL